MENIPNNTATNNFRPDANLPRLIFRRPESFFLRKSFMAKDSRTDTYFSLRGDEVPLSRRPYFVWSRETPFPPKFRT